MEDNKTFHDQQIPMGRPEVMRTLGGTEILEKIKQADVILGKDEETGNEFVVFGRSTLEGVVQSGQEMRAKVMVCSILQRTTELEALIDAVSVARGYHDYEAARTDS
jgi:hypothetical protein